MDDLIKQLRDMMYRMSWDDAKKLGEIIAALDGSTLATSKANAALEAAKARITALESERDALLAAAGKEAVAVAWMRSTDITELTDSEPEASGWIPLYTAPTAALENGDGRDAERYRWLSAKFDGNDAELSFLRDDLPYGCNRIFVDRELNIAIDSALANQKQAG
jgi:hypothetical protein